MDPKFNCMYVVILMAVYWTTEVIPINVTALIPIPLFPLLGVLDTRSACMEYLTDTNIMCIGSLVFTIAIEYCNLHNRLALLILKSIGCSHYKLHAGFAALTSFVSLWLTNMAATAMMCPIVMAILTELENQGLSTVYENRISVGPNANINDQKLIDDPVPTKLTVAYYLTLAYASTIGGTGTLIGTGTNMTLKGIFENIYSGVELSFPLWLIVWLPPMVITIIFVELGMQIQYLGLFRPKSKDAKVATISPEAQQSIQEVINAKYKELGPMTCHEITILILFILMVLLFFFRSPGFMPGFSVLFVNKNIPADQQKKYLKDAAAVVLLIILMFILPKKCDCFNFCRRKPDYIPDKTGQAAITWKYINNKLPWGFVFLLGSGFVLAKAGKDSGMNDYIGGKLNYFSGLNPILLILVVMIFVKFLTEFITNIAVASLTLPILAAMSSKTLKIHPMNLMMPATIASSHAFALPVGTPANAIIREYAFVPTPRMMIGSLWPSFVNLFVNWLLFISYGKLVYPELNTFPSWAKQVLLKLADGTLQMLWLYVWEQCLWQ
ncbi:protein I'm not dead yet-like [Ctenocephalides felis]|uniref:protein I'm not dead yet-like n=1 Tax=Ctenocephalides felis TaxID=7515 RepID=UPI000E6E5AE4|nr:protein I'm not dead yet-like [Ctenocephalides felis]